MIYTSLTVPRWLKDGITPNQRGSSVRKYLYGGDTETNAGRPITFQFFSKSAGRDDLIWIDNPDRASSALMRWCKSLQSHAQHVVYVHNLEFDMVSFFWDRKEKLVSTTSGEFEFTCGTWKITGVYGAPTFARMVDSSSHRTVIFVDSFSYYRASLKEAAKVFCPDLPKLEQPEGLGQRNFTPKDTAFCEYAMRDAVVAYYIGVALEALHGEFDLSQTVSVADMAARIFRHHFLERPIPQPARPVMECALNSYHGGKNNLAVEPGWYQSVSSIDISSAYPDAMSQMPSFYEARLYKKYAAQRGVREVPPLGVYVVRGWVSDCRWPVLFGHNFVPLRGEAVPGVCVCGFELNEALRSREFEATSISGWFYDADRDNHAPPLKAYVADFYARKEAEEDPAKRAMYKFLLNAISGKFIQTRKQDKVSYVDAEDGSVVDSGDLVAGGMFHPFIASLITGHTRAKIHQLEHKYEAMHTATDGIFTQMPVPKTYGKKLGAAVNEAHGDLLLLRNKLYILYGEGPPPSSKMAASAVFKGRHIIKAALHGFAGSVADLEVLATTGVRTYKATKPNRLRTSVKRGLTPNDFTVREFKLGVGRLPVHYSKQIRRR